MEDNFKWFEGKDLEGCSRDLMHDTIPTFTRKE
jgi:hypothetical protein